VFYIVKIGFIAIYYLLEMFLNLGCYMIIKKIADVIYKRIDSKKKVKCNFLYQKESLESYET